MTRALADAVKQGLLCLVRVSSILASAGGFVLIVPAITILAQSDVVFEGSFMA